MGGSSGAGCGNPPRSVGSPVVGVLGFAALVSEAWKPATPMCARAMMLEMSVGTGAVQFRDTSRDARRQRIGGIEVDSQAQKNRLKWPVSLGLKDW